MRHLVAGGAGFIGSHLCERLIAGGDHVICIDNLSTGRRENVSHLFPTGRFEFRNEDVRYSFPLAELDRVWNLACPASPPKYQLDPIKTIDVSVNGTANLLAVAQANGARFLMASTSEVYGDPLHHPQREDHWGNVNPIGPRSMYDEGKRCAEALCRAWAEQRGVQVRIARIFNTYGPRMDPEDGRVVSNFIVQALRKKPLTVYGDGQQTRSFTYVDDLVSGLMALMEANVSWHPVNLGNPREFTIMQLADLVEQRIGPCLRQELPLPEDDPVRRRPDIARAKELLGWEPMVPLENGLRETIAYFRSVVSE